MYHNITEAPYDEMDVDMDLVEKEFGDQSF